jgi:hypothetical protein
MMNLVQALNSQVAHVKRIARLLERRRISFIAIAASIKGG